MSTGDPLTLDASDRLLILAPHPDDETIATGGVIQKALAMGLPVHVVYLTYGDNAETSFIVYRKRLVVGGEHVQQMGLVRHDEAVAANGVLGLSPDRLTFLGYPDFRTLTIWTDHWGDAQPCESMFTRTTAVPYDNAYRPGAPYKADEILADIEAQIRRVRPTKIFVSHPADHNPDHLSLYLFTRIALWNLAGEIQPQLFPALVHHPEWPAPAGLNPQLPLDPPARLERDNIWHANPLTPEEVSVKETALQQHRTQYKMSAGYLNSFIRSNELFGTMDEPVLRVSTEGQIVSSAQDAAGGVSQLLTNSERAKWVGVEQRGVWLEDGAVVVAVEFSRPLGAEVAASLYIFGYNPDRPFAEMPKLQVRFTSFGHVIQDGPRKLVKSPVSLLRSARGYQVRAPLDFLGYPKYVLGSVRTYARKVPLDWIAWRVIDIENDSAAN